jgi:argininosuccinate lyase
MWGGRFDTGPAEAFDRLNRSLPVDVRLWPQDVRGSKAWVRALLGAGVLAAPEAAELTRGLDVVARRLAEGAATGAGDEDVHTLVERLLYEEVGDLAGKLHTGRSRNDQVATDLRLWSLEAIGAVDRDVAALGRALVAQAQAGVDHIMPGYTHGQRAQPVRFGYLLLAHAWPLVRDRQRLADAARRTAILPLGSGALAGSGMAVDRDFLARELGFSAPTPNALDATGDRDFVAEILFALSLIATHVSRLGAELVALSGSEFGFVRVADAFASGSSLMPQKRNPDVFELARARSARSLGSLVSLLATLKGLPAGYSKDLQEDKAALFGAVDDVLLTLPAVRGAVETMTAIPERMRAALDAAMLATDLADGLVRSGVPFREAHHLIGRLVRLAEEQGTAVDRVPASASQGIHPALPGLIAALGSWEDSIERRATAGGSSRASVLGQIRELDRVFAT